jgi:hypothetical protein
MNIKNNNKQTTTTTKTKKEKEPARKKPGVLPGCLLGWPITTH